MTMIWILFTNIVLTLSACPYDSLTVSGQISCNIPKWMVDSKVCVTECPSRFIKILPTCPTCYNYCSKPNGSDAILFTLKFFGAEDLAFDHIEDPNTGTIFVNLEKNWYNDHLENSLLPSLDRGFYFDKRSGIFTDKTFIPGLYFTLNLWIKPLSSGEILNIQIGSSSYIRIWADSEIFKLTALIYDSSGFQIPISGFSTISYSSSWQYNSFALNQLSCDAGSINFNINGKSSEITTLSNSEISFSNEIYTWKFGKSNEHDSFTGFIYWLQVRADTSYIKISEIEDLLWHKHLSDRLLIANSGQPCDGRCSVCKGANNFECTTCVTGMQKLDDICLYGCPYGYDASCVTLTSPIIDQSFGSPDFQGFYGIFITGISEFLFYPFNSADAFDPVPAYQRGLYFDNTVFLMSPSFLLSHSFSMGAWIYVIYDGILFWKNSILQVDSTGYIRARSMEDNIPSAPYTISLIEHNQLIGWKFLSIVIAFSSGGSDFDIYSDGSLVLTTTVSNRIFRETSANPIYLGNDFTGWNGFVGFMYHFLLWNEKITDFSTVLNSFSFCGAGNKASCLPACTISQYWDGAACSACNSCSIGCTRAITCNLCDDPVCVICSGFGAGKCTQCSANADLVTGSCICKPTYGRSIDGLSCVACPSECSTCTISVYNKCDTCNSGYFFFALTGQCLSECPSGYNKNSGTNYCDYLTDLGISLDLTDQILLNTVSGWNIGNDNTNTYPDWSDVNDPIPAYKRGYFFNKNSYLESTVMIAPLFTISMWIKPIESGTLVTKYTSSEILIIVIETSGYPILSMKFSDSTTSIIRASINIFNSWHLLSFTGQVQTDGKTVLTLYINTISKSSLTTSSLAYFKDTISGTLYVGNDENLGNSGLHGFLAQLMIYNSYNHQTDDYTASSCVTGCSACPANHQCLSECDFDKYPDSCTNCPSCSQGCVSSFTCGLCRDKECNSCATFSGECTDCTQNAEKIAGHCQCIQNYAWDSISKSCQLIPLCDPICTSCSGLKFNECIECASGYYLTQSLCTSFCPTGYILNGFNCDSDPTYNNFLVFNLMLHQIKDIVEDLASNIPVLTGKDHKFYPNYDKSDPIATIYRGYYFSWSSYMQLPPYLDIASSILTFSPKLVISTWIKPLSETGIIFSKQSNGGGLKKYISLELINKAPALILTMKDSYTITYASNNPSMQVTLSQWNFVSGTSNLSPTPQQIISLTTNSYVDASNDIYASWLNDLDSSFLMTIGACYDNSMTLSSFFNGFLWDLKIFNAPVLVSSITSSTCNGCSLCPVDNDNNCLDNCNIDSYWNGNICEKCFSGCSITGCVRNDKNCNLCQDVKCEICDDYTSACRKCKPNASLIGANCQCNSEWYWNITNESCEKYSPQNVCNSSDTQTCPPRTFSANLTALADNSLCLSFSEGLEKNLTLDSFIVKIENQGEISYKIEKINNTCYYISLNLKNEISKGTFANLDFLNPNEIKSISNATLNESNFTVVLNFYDPDPYSSAIAAAVSQSQTLAQATVAGTLALSFINPNPSSLWSIMNSLQVLSYLTLSGIPFSSKLRAFLNNLNSFSLFPNFFSYFVDQNEGNSPYSQAESFGFETDLILINQGNDFSLILTSIAALPIALYFSQCSNRWIGKKLKKNIKSYHFSFYLRFWIQCYLELGASASIGIIELKFRNATQISNFIICSAVCVLLIITPGIYFWFSYKNKNRILSSEKTFLAVFSSFFYEFRTDGSFLATQYYFVFFLRRLIYIINIVYLRNYPRTEVTLNIVLSLMTIMHLLFYSPFKDKILQYNNSTTEILICLIMGLTGAYLFDIESNTMSNIESSIVAIIIVIPGVQLVSSITIFARTIYGVIKHQLSKKIKQKTEILPIENLHTKTRKNLRKVL